MRASKRRFLAYALLIAGPFVLACDSPTAPEVKQEPPATSGQSKLNQPAPEAEKQEKDSEGGKCVHSRSSGHECPEDSDLEERRKVVRS